MTKRTRKKKARTHRGHLEGRSGSASVGRRCPSPGERTAGSEGAAAGCKYTWEQRPITIQRASHHLWSLQGLGTLLEVDTASTADEQVLVEQLYGSL